MKALVTGPSSFIGSTLIEELDTLGFEVCALLEKNPSRKNLEGLKFQGIDGDLSDFDSLCRSIREMDYVFHLAELTAARSRNVLFEQNAKNTETLARAVAVARPDLSRFVYVSSMAAAG